MDADGTKGIMQVFKGNNTLKVADINDAQILSWATNIYKYGIKSAQTTREADSIKITADGPSSTDTLRDLNRYNINETPSGGNRGFSYVASTQAENKYNIFRNLPYFIPNFTTDVIRRVHNYLIKIQEFLPNTKGLFLLVYHSQAFSKYPSSFSIPKNLLPSEIQAIPSDPEPQVKSITRSSLFENILVSSFNSP